MNIKFKLLKTLIASTIVLTFAGFNQKPKPVEASINQFQTNSATDKYNPTLVSQQSPAIRLRAIKDRIKSGRTFRVVFNPKVGNMGTLSEDRIYRVTYQAHDNSFKVCGHHLGSNRFRCPGAYRNANVDYGTISLWGRVYKFDADRNVYDPDHGFAGFLTFRNF